MNKSIIIFLLSFNCIAITICKEKNLNGASCFNVGNNKKFSWTDKILLDKISYWDYRPSMYQVPAHSMMEIKKYLFKICKKTKDCRRVEDIFKNVESL